MKYVWEKWQHGTEWLWRSFTECKRQRKEGFQAKAVPAGGKADEGKPGMLLGAVRFGFIERSDSFLQPLCKTETEKKHTVLLLKCGAILSASC